MKMYLNNIYYPHGSKFHDVYNTFVKSSCLKDMKVALRKG